MQSILNIVTGREQNYKAYKFLHTLDLLVVSELKCYAIAKKLFNKLFYLDNVEL
jgi:hypothetical protein